MGKIDRTKPQQNILERVCIWIGKRACSKEIKCRVAHWCKTEYTMSYFKTSCCKTFCLHKFRLTSVFWYKYWRAKGDSFMDGRLYSVHVLFVERLFEVYNKETWNLRITNNLPSKSTWSMFVLPHREQHLGNAYLYIYIYLLWPLWPY